MGHRHSRTSLLRSCAGLASCVFPDVCKFRVMDRKIAKVYGPPNAGDVNPVEHDHVSNTDVIVGSEDGSLKLFLRDPNGTYFPIAGDVNPVRHDHAGSTDVVVGSEDGSLKLFLRDPSGPYFPIAGDVNPVKYDHVGSTDVIVGSEDGSLMLFLRDPSGTYFQIADDVIPLHDRSIATNCVGSPLTSSLQNVTREGYDVGVSSRSRTVVPVGGVVIGSD